MIFSCEVCRCGVSTWVFWVFLDFIDKARVFPSNFRVFPYFCEEFICRRWRALSQAVFIWTYNADMRKEWTARS